MSFYYASSTEMSCWSLSTIRTNIRDETSQTINVTSLKNADSWLQFRFTTGLTIRTSKETNKHRATPILMDNTEQAQLPEASETDGLQTRCFKGIYGHQLYL